jgi:hypothetical protein
MSSWERTKEYRQGERGATLVIFSLSLVMMMGMGALAVDLASMYVARNEAQRAADSAALAGAKYFVESGCVTVGNCATYETTAIARATEVAAKSFVEGQPATVFGTPTFDLTKPLNPQITVQVQSANLKFYFVRAFYRLLKPFTGIPARFKLGATATAEAWNPSGSTGGPIYCTGCVRPWVIPNCDQGNPGPDQNNLCNAGTPPVQAYLLNPSSNYGVENPGCYPGGVVGSPIAMRFQLQPTLYGAVDITNGSGNLANYQQAVPICSIGQQTCGTSIPFYILPVTPAMEASTQAGVEALLHVASTGPNPPNQQDYIDTSVCPPQIHAGGQNPLVTQGVVNVNNAISTSDSIVTAYIFDGAPIAPQAINGVSQNLNIVGFAQIFVTQVDLDALNNTEVQGVILGVAGCGSNIGACGAAAGSGTSINGPTTMPVRLITPTN